MDDIEEQKDISDQISEALTRNTADMFDDVSRLHVALYIYYVRDELCV
jgi:hypothetical protein